EHREEMGSINQCRSSSRPNYLNNKAALEDRPDVASQGCVNNPLGRHTIFGVGFEPRHNYRKSCFPLLPRQLKVLPELLDGGGVLNGHNTLALLLDSEPSITVVIMPLVLV